jgi:hypothetical protein
MGMVQLGGHPDLPQKPLSPQDLGQMGMEHLQRDVSVVLEITREINHGHAAVADLALNGIVPVEGGRELALQI